MLGKCASEWAYVLLVDMSGINIVVFLDIPQHLHDFHHKGEPGLPDWCNHLVTSRNRLPSHSVTRCLTSEEQALTCQLEQGPRTVENLILLTPEGTKWSFHFSGTPEGCPKVQLGKGFDSKGWDNIKVPACWETQGHGEALCE